MSDKNIDVVIINHNYGEYIARAIDSVLNQSRPVGKIIVVDDGSTDGSREIIEGYGDKVVSVFQGNLGHVRAVNAGFAHVEEDLCIFLDADDFLYPECASEVASAWRPADSKIQFRLDTVDRDGVNQNMPFPYFEAGITPAELRQQSLQSSWYPWTVSSGSAFSTEFLRHLLPINHEEIYRSPDGYLSKLAPLYGDVRSISAVLGAYRVHGGNAWARSGQSWKVDTAIRWLKFDQILESAFVREAQRQNVGLNLPLCPSFQQLEYRFLAFRFAPEQSPYTTDNRSGLLRSSMFACLNAKRPRAVARALWFGWFLALLFAPKPLVASIVTRARGQTGRSDAARLILRVVRGGR